MCRPRCRRHHTCRVGPTSRRSTRRRSGAPNVGQCPCGPGLQLLLLPIAQPASAAARLEMQQSIKAILQKHAVPLTNGIVIQKQGSSGFLATPASVEKHRRIGAGRANRCAAEPPRAKAITPTRSSGDKNPARIMRQQESPNHSITRNFSGFQ